ncbi:MAG: Histone deacetylase hda1 [Chrysothrix sp. TS-e1954]|nr:MAG: Histone deacetylase hda1 [Chrysothrix sp. TS-e1954]
MEAIVQDPMDVVVTTEDHGIVTVDLDEIASSRPMSELPGPHAGIMASALDRSALLHSHASSQSGRGETTNSNSEDDESTTSESSAGADRSSEGIAYMRQPGTGALIPVIPREPKFRPLPYATARTGIVYDAKMGRHSSLEFDDDHPEAPERIYGIIQGLRAAGLLPEDDETPGSDFQLLRIKLARASKDELCLVHSEGHVDRMMSTASWTTEELLEFSRKSESVFVNDYTYYSAVLAAGGAMAAVREVIGRRVRNSVAIIRPPGHHAEHDAPSGFCIFNNVPVAVKVAQREWPDQCRKVLILDWDVHHGNGIQRAFYNDPNVLYISIHVYQNAAFYPYSTFGDHVHCGEGAGLGRNVNIPWLSMEMSDSDYILAFQQVVMPIAQEFDPDLVVISAGFDAAVGDPIGNCNVTPAGYAHMTHMLMSLARGKVVACLEGGYNVKAIETSAVAMTRTLMGEPPERLGELKPSLAAINTLQLVIRTQARYWNCLYPRASEFDRIKDLESDRLHDVIREWQANKYFELYDMTPLHIMNEDVSKSYKDRVLATPNYFEKRPMLVIFHDAPEAEADNVPSSNRLDLHKIRITDYAKNYIEWATKHDFAVVDVNTPRFLTDVDDTDEVNEARAKQRHAAAVADVAKYLWQNYLDLGDTSHFVFMAIGDSSAGLVRLLKQDNDILRRVHLVINFISAYSPLNGVMNEDDPSIAKTYKSNSMIFAADDHDAYMLAIKLKRKHGNVIRSPYTNVQQMLKEHMDEVTSRLLEIRREWTVQVADDDDVPMVRDNVIVDTAMTDDVAMSTELNPLDAFRNLKPRPAPRVQVQVQDQMAESMEAEILQFDSLPARPTNNANHLQSALRSQSPRKPASPKRKASSPPPLEPDLGDNGTITPTRRGGTASSAMSSSPRSGGRTSPFISAMSTPTTKDNKHTRKAAFRR